MAAAAQWDPWGPQQARDPAPGPLLRLCPLALCWMGRASVLVKGPRPGYSTMIRRWGPARQGEGSLCNLPHRPALCQASWGHGQGLWGAETPLPDTPSTLKVLGGCGERRVWRRDGPPKMAGSVCRPLHTLLPE